MHKPLLAGSLLTLLVGCSEPQTILEQVLSKGELRVLTRVSHTTYYEGPDGPKGLEYDLARGLADELGVELRLIVANNVGEILQRLARQEAHLAAAGLTITGERQESVRFGTSYQEITPQLVYRLGTPRPRSMKELDGQLEVLAGSSHAERLRQLDREFPDLNWVENREADSDELLNLVWERVIDYTVVDSNELQLNRRFYPELRVAFELSEPEQLAWAFPKGDDDSLFRATERYFAKLKTSGELTHLLERHYGHVDDFNYAGTRIYRRHIAERLPRFRGVFEDAAEVNDLDWRLLAAMGYQESHWDPKAVSPTGVRGLMMLTRNTAKTLGVSERTDPTQSITGGALYVRQLLDAIPQRIPAPDRVWFALAAYNIGLGHLEDARVITEQRGGNPDKWVDVKRNLPLLRKKAWYRKTRYGYARGDEAALYVERIRSYYDILVWLTEREKPSVAPQSIKALDVLSPVL